MEITISDFNYIVHIYPGGLHHKSELHENVVFYFCVNAVVVYNEGRDYVHQSQLFFILKCSTESHYPFS